MFKKKLSKIDKKERKFSKKSLIKPSFRIKNINPKNRSNILNKKKFLFINLKSIKQKICSLRNRLDPQISLHEKLFKFHFNDLDDKVKELNNVDNFYVNKVNNLKINECTFNKIKTNKLIVVSYSLEIKTMEIHKNSKLKLLKDKKMILIIEFDGTLGYFYCNDKGYIDILYLQNLKCFFKKLSKYFDLVVVFKRKENSAFFKKMTKFINEFESFIKVFAVSPNDKNINIFREKYLLKFHKGKKKNNESKILKKLFTKKKRDYKLFINLDPIEKLFNKKKPIIIFSPIDLDLTNLDKKKGKYKS